jgi:Heavy metal associated domain 2
VNQCIHHIPGRIRVRVHAIKGCAQKARAIQSELQAKQGVRSVDFNLRTGSILIGYNPRECDISELLPSFNLSRDRVDIGTYNASRDRIGDKVLKAVGSCLLELAVQRATLALVAAIL